MGGGGVNKKIPKSFQKVRNRAVGKKTSNLRFQIKQFTYNA